MPAERIAVLGAGAGGAAACVELAQAGYDVLLWNRSAETLAGFERGVRHEGVLGSGIAHPAVTADLARVAAEADAAVVVLPTFLHGTIGAMLAQAGWPAERPVVLNPGHTGGGLAFAQAFGGQVALAEFSTLTYVARKPAPDAVSITGRAKSVRAAALPGGAAALALACRLFPGAEAALDVLATGLANVNMVLHPPGAVLAAAWVEARAGDFTFYVDAMTPGVARVMASLDDERRAVARAFGHELPALVEEMRRIGTVEADFAGDGLAAAIAAGEANRRIKAPDGFGHRYYREDFGYGLAPFLALAEIAGVACPTAGALVSLARTATGASEARSAEDMGIAGLDRDQLIERIRA
ncbi:NAD/NADP octopine/nopaline dehydrogenase family protein [Sphingomonas sp.]|uniref:NAD/NADP octopine/nopaline dehydrogenase family protein n=1 Tax=Sphingomonas sp. TaxID=28214 RepID=UPI001B27B335|nr:NAD/NADP octopine/nopaline dehydrogenase family protein [Sphingomonas sp.]MBO9711674.1 NAD/NADP octopine/nopaline dehydrogenase family protein [Sphingomonas sp.]